MNKKMNGKHKGQENGVYTGKKKSEFRLK